MKGFLFFALCAGLFFPLLGNAAVNTYRPESVGAGKPEVYIRQDGSMMLKSGRVEQITGTTFYLSVSWGTVPMRFTMKTDGKTMVTKRYGGSAAVSQIQPGDYLDIEGTFFVGSDFFGLTALVIKDWSLQEEAETFVGVITDIADRAFTLQTTRGKAITVRVNDGASLLKVAVAIPFGLLKKGDAVPITDGVYDYASNVLSADRVLVYQAKGIFAARNFEGVLKEMTSRTLPAALTVTVGGVDYRVVLNEKAAVLRKDRSPVQLGRFVVGDTVRFYGPLREEEYTLHNAQVVDAEVVRNVNL